MSYYNDFDVSYEAYLWLDNTGHGTNGAPHDMKAVYEDMEECEGFIYELYQVVDKYIDDAVLAGIPTVRIIHGKGTGALRAALWKFFKSDKRIKAYRHGEYGEGDAGVTVLTLGK